MSLFSKLSKEEKKFIREVENLIDAKYGLKPHGDLEPLFKNNKPTTIKERCVFLSNLTQSKVEEKIAAEVQIKYSYINQSGEVIDIQRSH